MQYVVLTYLILLLLYTILKKYWKASSYLIGVYACSVFLSFFLLKDKPNDYYVSFIPSIIFCLMLTVYFFPFFRRSPFLVQDSSLEFTKKFTFIGYFFGGLLILSMIFLYTRISDVFAWGLAETRQAMYRGEDVFRAYTIFEHLGHSCIKWLGGVCYTLMIMLFYSIAFMPGKRALKIILLISTLASAYYGSLSAGRTNLTYWLLYMFFCLSIFWKYMSFKSKRYLTVILLSLLGLLLIYFGSVTIQRARLGHGGETGEFLIGYMGQSYPNFCKFMDECNWHPYSFRRILPLTSTIFLGRFNLVEYRAEIYDKTNLNIGIFYTHLGDIFVDIGIIGLFIYSLIFYLITKRVMNKKIMVLSDYLVIGLLYQIPLFGVFYYNLWKMETSAGIITTLLISIYLRTKNSKDVFCIKS